SSSCAEVLNKPLAVDMSNILMKFMPHGLPSGPLASSISTGIRAYIFFVNSASALERKIGEVLVLGLIKRISSGESVNRFSEDDRSSIE
ncbi:MAG TPA: hypothetical protein VLQ80_34580, partial [Candidatus Saccharimonadia bacterium]|nr:hypothetical protein [Candidatus Saccharimonadia bacterium]